jgi:hypothetical protein
MTVVGESAMDERVKPLQHRRTTAPGILAQEIDQRTQTDLSCVTRIPPINGGGGSGPEEGADAVGAEVEDLADVVQSEPYAGALASDLGRPLVRRLRVGGWAGVRRRWRGRRRRNVVIARRGVRLTLRWLRGATGVLGTNSSHTFVYSSRTGQKGKNSWHFQTKKPRIFPAAATSTGARPSPSG